VGSTVSYLGSLQTNYSARSGLNLKELCFRKQINTCLINALELQVEAWIRDVLAFFHAKMKI
jgi:hypothetical protein